MAARQGRWRRLMRTEFKRKGRRAEITGAPSRAATLTRLACRSARRVGSGTRNIFDMLPHSPASSAVERPAMLIICVLPNREHWAERLAMNGQYPSAQLITDRSTVLATKNSGGERRELIRLRMRRASGGTRGTAESSIRTRWNGLGSSGSNLTLESHDP